ncbi:AAA domain-containing protein [Mycobacterium sp. BK086]|uniref:AAA family ATPase n=1 Tax=Mycobacterium sp. BK086 TaxID=2512165 RepID=UPI001061EA93|nr:AAA family ATPase [Mycobacterium sp. BK086]TDO14622.1 AAA domain-containing protein [Mycobacterium sp. BK086]
MIGEEVLDVGFVPINWSRLDAVVAATAVIPGLLNEGESGSLVAQAAAGKSLLMLEIAVGLASGATVLGQPPREPITVLYVDMENPVAELANRLRRMGHSPADLAGRPLHYFSFPDLPPLDTAAGGQRIALAAEVYEPQLIVLDTISRLVEGKEDSADTWRNLYNFTMMPLRRQGRTVLRLDHQGHDSNKGARGSSAKRDDVDVAWIMKRAGDDIALSRDKGRGLDHPEKIYLRRHANPTRHLPATANDKLAECIEALDKLHVPLEASRDVAGTALRTSGYSFRNDVIGPALKARRSSASPPDEPTEGRT